jgi:hypothetical protein
LLYGIPLVADKATEVDVPRDIQFRRQARRANAHIAVAGNGHLVDPGIAGVPRGEDDVGVGIGTGTCLDKAHLPRLRCNPK